MKRAPELKTPSNPLVSDTAYETICLARNLATFISFTAGTLATGGTSNAATDGLSLVMQVLTEALEHAEAQLEQEHDEMKLATLSPAPRATKPKGGAK